MPIDGISRLIAVTQMKSANANQSALDGASQQQGLIRQQKQLRGVQSQLSSSQGGQAYFAPLKQLDQKRALDELQQRLRMLRRSLSPAAAALFDQWVEWAAEHR